MLIKVNDRDKGNLFCHYLFHRMAFHIPMFLILGEVQNRKFLVNDFLFDILKPNIQNHIPQCQKIEKNRQVESLVLIQCFKNVFSYIKKEKNLVLGKKISAQPTASKKIKTPLRIGVVFKGLGFGGRNRDFKVEKAISR